MSNLYNTDKSDTSPHPIPYSIYDRPEDIDNNNNNMIIIKGDGPILITSPHTIRTRHNNTIHKHNNNNHKHNNDNCNNNHRIIIVFILIIMIIKL